MRSIYQKILRIGFLFAIFCLLKLPQRCDEISYWERWNGAPQNFWSKSLGSTNSLKRSTFLRKVTYCLQLPKTTSFNNFIRTLPMGKTSIFQLRSLGTRLTIFMENLLFRTLILFSSFMFYFIIYIIYFKDDGLSTFRSITSHVSSDMSVLAFLSTYWNFSKNKHII